MGAGGLGEFDKKKRLPVIDSVVPKRVTRWQPGVHSGSSSFTVCFQRAGIFF